MKFLAAAALASWAGSACLAQVPLTAARLTGTEAIVRPVFLTQPRTETQRLYVVSQYGSIHVIKNGTLLSTPFLNIQNQISYGGESGLLGFAFHPQFATNGYFYVYFSRLDGVYVVRFSTDPANPEQADPLSAQQIMSIPGIRNHHFGGWMDFGPDGYLYIASGNAFNQSASSSLTTPLGKMLRIDVDHDDFPADPTRNYAIPPSNPFFGSTSAVPEIWATGLRNPWRNSIDRLTGDLWISDVGDSISGEIDFQPAGLSGLRNYGYPCLDGFTCYGVICSCNDPSLTPPIYATPYGGAIIGGYVYRGTKIAGLQGTYIFGDYFEGFHSFRYSGGILSEFTDRTTEIAIPSGSPSSLGEDSSGELYICTLYFGVYKIVPPCPANCDNSNTEPRLNINDFQCFLNKFAAGDPAANCDRSTTPPTLTAADFTCFLNLYAAGCP